MTDLSRRERLRTKMVATMDSKGIAAAASTFLADLFVDAWDDGADTGMEAIEKALTVAFAPFPPDAMIKTGDVISVIRDIRKDAFDALRS